MYAIGECSCTGLHGGNRLASNSLIEAVVYADAAAKHALNVLDRYDFNEDIPEWNDEGTMNNEERVLITQSMKEVNQIMEAYVGIVRSNTQLSVLGTDWIFYMKKPSVFSNAVRLHANFANCVT